jgi:hypothetical protein
MPADETNAMVASNFERTDYRHSGQCLIVRLQAEVSEERYQKILQ